jgi:type IV secretory pathway VirB2 component (pilin)
MKDIVITPKMIHRELYVVLGCFVAACLTNVGAIIAYDRPWSELVTQIGFVLFITGGIYTLLAVVRILICLMGRLFKKS